MLLYISIKAPLIYYLINFYRKILEALSSPVNFPNANPSKVHTFNKNNPYKRGHFIKEYKGLCDLNQ